MRFTKLHGCGNDYLYVNCFAEREPLDPPALARVISERHFGVGSDGLILVLPSEIADARMRMFNADGSEGAMCGNGVRAMAKFVHDQGISLNNPLRIETGRGVLSIQLHPGGDGKVASATVDMDEPILELERIGVEPARVRPIRPSVYSMHATGVEVECSFVSMGSAHAIRFIAQVQWNELKLAENGPRFEVHPAFPNRINYHEAVVLSRGELNMRTWEKGSGITLACGTGACAVVVAGVLTGKLDRQVLTHLPGGDLQIEWRESNNHVYMTGPAIEVFSGEWQP
jgi:diaminopimelate epimerase